MIASIQIMQNFSLAKSLAELAAMDTQKLENFFETSAGGLKKTEAAKRLKVFGKNVLVEEKKHSIFLDFLVQFRNPMVLILAFAAVVSFIFGQAVDGIIILFIIFFSTVLNVFQERKASHAAQKLKEGLKTRVVVIREGKKIEIKLEEVVPGDLIFLNAGDLVPADARIIEAKDFFVNQSALTGESFPVEKNNLALQNDQASLNELVNIVFCGTNVVTGTAVAIAVKTGRETEFGKIAHSLNQQEETTEFTEGINKFSHLILKTTFIIVMAIFLFNIVLKKDVLESFLFAIAVAVGLTPELLPMILSVNMSTGSMRMAKKGVIVKKLVAIPEFGSMDVLCTDKTGTLTQDKIALVKYTDVTGADSKEVLLNAYLNSVYQTGITNPMDEAVKKYRHLDIAAFKKIDEIPFDFLRKRMSVVVEKDGQRTLICKGAPEEIFAQCVEAGTLRVAEKVYADLSGEGYRVVAIAIKQVDQGRHVYEIGDETGLTLLGFIAFLDPPKTDVRDVVRKLENAGVKIKIITGDNELVTQKICRELGIPVHGVLKGHEIDGLTDDALRVKVEKNTIFARFSPDEKNRIIHALKANGHVVGYMGDGINDAPSLKTADVGISVNNAVDVAKESADIILTEKSLEVLLVGILEGRKTFGNSMKYIKMGVSSNFGNMFSVIGAVIFLPFLPMLPMQILLNNLLYDFSQITIPGDHVDEEYITRPKRWNMAFVRKFMVMFGLISSFYDFVTFFVLFKIFNLGAHAFQTGWFIESLATQTLIIHIIRTRKLPFIQSRPSTGLLVSTLLIVTIGWLLPFTAAGQFFTFTPLSGTILIAIAAIVICYLITVEISKRIFYRLVRTD